MSAATLLQYVTGEAAAALPPALRTRWAAVEQAAGLRQRLEQTSEPLERARMLAAARDFEARLLQWLRRDLLPAGDLVDATLLVPGGVLELHGGRGDLKVRVDETLSTLIVGRFSSPWPRQPDEAAVLERLRALLALPLDPGSVTVERIGAFEQAGAVALLVRLAPVDELGWALGRYEAALAYLEPHLVLAAPVPRRAVVYTDLPQAAAGEEIELGALEPPPAGAPGTGPPPRGGARSPAWSAEDAARVAFCREVARRTAAGAGPRLELDATGEALDERIDLGQWRSGRYDEVQRGEERARAGRRGAAGPRRRRDAE